MGQCEGVREDNLSAADTGQTEPARRPSVLGCSPPQQAVAVRRSVAVATRRPRRASFGLVSLSFVIQRRDVVYCRRSENRFTQCSSAASREQ